MKTKKTTTNPFDLFINTTKYHNNNAFILGKPGGSSKTRYTGNGYETYYYGASDDKEIISQDTNECQKSETKR
jgi:hypothetical protein